ncbi:general transcription and DNA repair factor IIH subunit TFB2-like, partial [Salvia splendens]|uniref:general transcription and DNA repair factor IIH subunit TFB2-like n=1 Tax=Salvia splendens TaxID=180675 RepID=UPI001C25AF1C
MPQVRIVARNFMDMVASLPPVKLDKLYENSFICEAILRSLPPLAKKYVLLLLYIEGPVSAKWLEEWILADGASKHKVAIDRLIQLRVLTETVERKKEATYQFNPPFQRISRSTYCMGNNAVKRHCEASSTEELDAYAVEQWE